MLAKFDRLKQCLCCVCMHYLGKGPFLVMEAMKMMASTARYKLDLRKATSDEVIRQDGTLQMSKVTKQNFSAEALTMVIEFLAVEVRCGPESTLSEPARAKLAISVPYVSRKIAVQAKSVPALYLIDAVELLLEELERSSPDLKHKLSSARVQDAITTVREEQAVARLQSLQQERSNFKPTPRSQTRTFSRAPVQPPHNSFVQGASATKRDDVCRDFNFRECRRGAANCRFKHACAGCGMLNIPRRTCSQCSGKSTQRVQIPPPILQRKSAMSS